MHRAPAPVRAARTAVLATALAGVFAAVLAGAASAFAHDFWIEPSAWRPRAGDELAAALRVGDEFPGEPVARDDLRIERFELVGPSGATSFAGERGKDPAGRAKLADAGLHVLGYRSRRRYIELDAEKFEAYLREEGLERVVGERSRLGESEAQGREVYSRCAKSLVVVQPQAAGTAATPAAKESSPAGADAPRRTPVAFDHVLGFPLEIVPVADPTAAAPGAELAFVVRHAGVPVEGVLVGLRSPASKDAPRARTDTKGRVTLKVAAAGLQLVHCVHMVRAPKETGAEWESLWASLTFEVRAPEPERRVGSADGSSVDGGRADIAGAGTVR